MKSERHDQHSGLTILEVLVVIGILGILVALTMPAVLNSREASRRLQCLSHLRQIGLAANQYENAHGVYPSCSGIDGPSPLVRMLPYVAEESLYAQLNLDLPRDKKLDLARLRPAVYVCPSNSMASSSPMPPCYAGNGGWDLPREGNLGALNSGVITFIIVRRQVRAADVLDGLSQTVLYGEVRPADGRPETKVWDTPLHPDVVPPERLAADCLAATQSSVFRQYFTLWIIGGHGLSTYDHVLTPNGRNCNAVYTAGSSHPTNGANVVFCDGSGRFIHAAIDLALWRALGTKDGQDNGVLE